MITNFKIYESVYNSEEMINIISNFLKRLKGSRISINHTDEHIMFTTTDAKDYYYIIYISVDSYEEEKINFNLGVYINSDRIIIKPDIKEFMKNVYDFLKYKLSDFNYYEHYYPGTPFGNNFDIKYSYYDDIISTFKKLKKEDFDVFVNMKKYNL